MIFFQQFYLDKEKDIAVDLRMEEDRLFYTIRTPNHHTGNLITNLARLCGLKTEEDDQGLKVIRDEIPCYYDGDNRKMYIFRLGNTKIVLLRLQGPPMEIGLTCFSPLPRKRTTTGLPSAGVKNLDRKSVV